MKPLQRPISFIGLFFEGVIYAIICMAIYGIVATISTAVLSYFFPMEATPDTPENPLSYISTIFTMLAVWIGSSAFFAVIKPQYTFNHDFIRFMVVGFLSHLLFSLFIMFVIYDPGFISTILNALFMGLWNFFSGGSSEFGIAFFSLIPTIFAFIVIIIVFVFLIWILFYMLFKPLADALMLPYEKSKEE